MRHRIIALATTATLALAGLAVSAGPASADPHEDHCDGTNLILGSRYNDVLNGTFCDDVILGFGGDDVLRGKAGEDVLRGGRGNDRLNSVEVLDFPQADVVRGGTGFDRCVIDFLDVAIACEDVIEVDPF